MHFVNNHDNNHSFNMSSCANPAVEPPDKSMYLNFIGHCQCDFQSVIAMLSTLMSYLNLTWYDKVLAFCQTDSYDMEF